MEKENTLITTPVDSLKGIGPKNLIKFQQKGIRTLEDLFYFLPIRYEDKRFIKKICDAREGEKAIFVGEVVASRSLFFKHARKKAYEAIVRDETGVISIKWFQWNKEYLKKVAKKGNILFLSGQVTKFRDKLQIIHPEIILLDSPDEVDAFTAIVPVYSEIEGIKQGSVRKLIKQLFDDYGRHVKSIIPDEIEKIYNLTRLYDALFKIHFPEEMMPGNAGRHPMVDRLILEEYALFQMGLHIKRQETKKERGIRFEAGGPYYTKLMDNLPFQLTSSQVKVIEEIKRDMEKVEPMHRLLQGDVGCGKTVCAVIASCIAIDNGWQVAFMAPTEILAEQHYLTIHRTFEGLGIPVVLLRGNMGKERDEIINRIKGGEYPVVVGTHALIQEEVVFKNLGFVIIDEQHRFGVIQRKLLRDKGSITPHVLVMTATPIPRTLSMVVYGDLDVSIINEMPPGRQKIETHVFLEKDREKAYRMIDKEIKMGHQAYVVYPLIEESEKVDLLNARERATFLQESVFPMYRIGLLHGRMKAEEKEIVMSGFKNREIDILVCTTVIEVGIDVPNATIIVIENAERFGLSQLHQLRGRVGRGAYPSGCILVASLRKTDTAAKRLKVMEKEVDGFVIAEEDLKIRGPGDLFGVRQSGIPDFRVGDIVRDGDIMTLARKIAGKIVSCISDKESEAIKDILKNRWKENLNLFDIA